MSGSKIFSYAGQRIAVIAVSNTLFKREYPAFEQRYGIARFGQTLIQAILYCLSSGTSVTPQYALAAMLKAANDGELDFVKEVSEYGRRARLLKDIFEKNGFNIIYDKDLDEPLSDGFFFTIGYKGIEGGELLRRLLHYGVSAIVLSTTGSSQQGLRVCSSTVKPHHYDMLDRRLAMFNDNN
jgi:aspartate/methionine/tyrosine aminotransferase